MSCLPRYKNVTPGTTGPYQLPSGLLYPKGAATDDADRIDITRRREEILSVGLPISLANRIGYPHSQYFIEGYWGGGRDVNTMFFGQPQQQSGGDGVYRLD